MVDRRAATRAARSAVAPTSSGSARCSARVRALAPPRAAVGRRLPAVVPPHWANSGRLPLTATVLRDTPSRRFVRFERRPVVMRAESSPFWRSVAATSCTFFRRSDGWIGNFFAPSQSRFAGPTSSACISSTAAPFGVLPVPARS
ncbi:putative proline-rich receptor-like protein kinase PERK13 [Iris pallida]|uniref:Proline-rich receptor-like protein kinase PERK13 n=1 Tax=Iris pallida TaxID=29817 RepID=A0AAX6F9W7_IRIPA|nr:putative proline-rich receptor-like protein kinase PERK13 [Iris pallida]